MNTNPTTPVALVTGGSRRIGAAISRRLHQRGLNIAVHCRNASHEADTLAAELNHSRAGSAIVVQADLMDVTAIEAMVATVAERFGRLDVLVHNASSFYPTPVGATTTTQWDDLFHSNLRGPYFLSQAAAPWLRSSDRKGGAAIITIVDIHASKPLSEHNVYCMTKAGLAMMTQSLAKELAPDVRVNGVAPGYILRPPHGMSDETHELILERTPLGRQGSADEIAGAVCYLALDATYVSGQILAVDGGRGLHM